MKTAYLITIVLTVLFFLGYNLNAQDISFVPHDTFLYADPGTTGVEIIFEADVTNLDTTEHTVFLVKEDDDLPTGWISSLCFDACFPSEFDSIATTGDFGSTPLAPGETRVVSLHVFTDNTIQTGEVQVQAGTFRHPDDRIIVNFIATTDPAVEVKETNVVNSYSLKQNFPNPFNPSTKINYTLSEAGFVQLRVYNILGVEVATLVKEYEYSGNHSVDFNAAKLSSGVYLYQLSINNFTQTRKMILEK